MDPNMFYKRLNIIQLTEREINNMYLFYVKILALLYKSLQKLSALLMNIKGKCNVVYLYVPAVFYYFVFSFYLYQLLIPTYSYLTNSYLIGTYITVIL